MVNLLHAEALIRPECAYALIVMALYRDKLRLGNQRGLLSPQALAELDRALLIAFNFPGRA